MSDKGVIRTSVLARNAELDAHASLANDGFVQIFDGPRPRSVEDEPGREPLAECKLGSPAFKKASAGSIRATEIDKERSSRAGKANWYRTTTRNRQALWDGLCTGRGQGGSCELDHLEVQDGADLTITSLVYTLPE